MPMSPSLSAIMLPPRPPADPYDVPASPLRASSKRVDTPPATKAYTPVRDLDRLINHDNEPKSERKKEVTVVAAAAPAPEPAKEEATATNGTAKEDATEAKTPKKTADEPKPEAKEPASAAKPIAPIDGDIGEVEIDSFISHRVDEDNATVDIQVKWITGDKTWEPEWSLQHQVPALVFKYWDSLNGREAATGLDIYHVFRILKRAAHPHPKKRRFMYEVQWVGYRRAESSWEDESKVKEIAPDELIKFEAKNGVASDVPAQKRGPGRGPGRPRKKAKASSEE